MEAISKVFPATITSGQSAGDKSRKAASKKASAVEESAANTTGQKKNKKKNKSTSSAGMDTGVAVAVDITTAAAEEEVTVDVDEAAVIQPEAMQTRPGISYERISNLFDPYVTGICVRP